MAVTTHSSPYDLFASIYSRWMAEDFCRRIFPVIARLFLSQLPHGARIVDLCCGTGQMARALSRQGFLVAGIDSSTEMLRLAERNAPRAEFILADARSFCLPRQFQGALSTFNSLAHLDTTDELESAFRNVRAALLPEAPFLFDITMEDAYATKWQGQLHFAGDDCTCTVEPTYDKKTHAGRNEVTLSDGPRRTQFCIEQRCHSPQELHTALASAGFTAVESFDAQSDLGLDDEWGRRFFLCT